MMINADYTLRNVLNSQNSFHLKVLNEKNNMMARNCRYFVWCSTHLAADMIQAVEGCLTRAREVSSPPPRLYLISDRDRQSQSQGYPKPADRHKAQHQANLKTTLYVLDPLKLFTKFS